METVLEIQHLSKKFGNHYALRDVSLTIEKGDIYGLIGRNGAGKTTLLKIINQLIEQTDGTVSLFGSNSDSQFIQENLQHQIKVVDDHTLHIFGQAENINPIVVALVKENIHINGIHYSRQNLESYFTQLVSGEKEDPTHV